MEWPPQAGLEWRCCQVALLIGLASANTDRTCLQHVTGGAKWDGGGGGGGGGTLRAKLRGLVYDILLWRKMSESDARSVTQSLSFWHPTSRLCRRESVHHLSPCIFLQNSLLSLAHTTSTGL